MKVVVIGRYLEVRGTAEHGSAEEAALLAQYPDATAVVPPSPADRILSPRRRLTMRDLLAMEAAYPAGRAA